MSRPSNSHPQSAVSILTQPRQSRRPEGSAQVSLLSNRWGIGITDASHEETLKAITKFRSNPSALFQLTLDLIMKRFEFDLERFVIGYDFDCACVTPGYKRVAVNSNFFDSGTFA